MSPNSVLVNDEISQFMLKLAAEASRIGIEDARKALLGDLNVREVSEKGGRPDYVLETDLRIQSYIAGIIGHELPQDGFVAEHPEGRKDSQNNRRWVLDPIDGTGQFKIGERNWACCALALQERIDEEWVTTHSVVVIPAIGVTYLANEDGAFIRNANFFGDDEFHKSDDFRGRWHRKDAPPKKTALAGMTVDFRLVGEEQAETIAREYLRERHKYSPRTTGAMATALSKAVEVAPGSYAVVGGGQQIWDWTAAAHLATSAGYQCEEVVFEGLGKGGKDYKVVLAAEDPMVMIELKHAIARGLQEARANEMRLGRNE